MKIAALETVRVDPFPSLASSASHRGITGLGETFYGAEAVESDLHAVAAPLLLGATPADRAPRPGAGRFRRLRRHWR